MGFLKDIDPKPSNPADAKAQAGVGKNKFPSRAPAVSTQHVPAEPTPVIRDVGLLRVSAPHAAPEDAGHLPSVDIKFDAKAIDPAPSPAPTKMGQALQPEKGHTLDELLAMESSDLLTLAAAECKSRGIDSEDSLLDDNSMRIFVKALNNHGIPFFFLKARMEAVPSQGAEAMAQDDGPETMVEPQGPKAPPKPPPAPKLGLRPPVAKTQPLDTLGIHAAIDEIETDPYLNASQKAEAAVRHFQENKGIQDFMAGCGEGFIQLLESAANKLRGGKPPDADERVALDINELFNYIKKKEEQAGVYSGVRRDIDAQQGQNAQSAPVPFPFDSAPGQRMAEPAKPQAPIEEQGSAFTRFITSPTTLSALGAAAFGGVLYHIGGFEDLTLGFNKLFKAGAARDTMIAAYASIASLSILAPELLRRFKVDSKAATYESVEKLPDDLKDMYKQVLGKLTLIARTHAKREDQTKALVDEFKDEGFFISIDELLRMHRGEPLVAAIEASGLNPKVPVLEAMRMAERKIMKAKFETIADHLDDAGPRRARFKSMYALDPVFRKECDKLLVADKRGRFLNYPTLVAICSLVKGRSGEKIAEQLIEALKSDYSDVDSGSAK
jgi:hypothetical protein